MKRMFIETHEFRKGWSVEGLEEDDLFRLESYLLERPYAGDVIRGTGGVRKLRWSGRGKGKSGGIRVVYFDLASRSTIWLLTIFAKSERVDLTAQERREIKLFVKRLGSQE